MRRLGTLEVESESYAKVLKWLSIVYWQLSLGLYIVDVIAYACTYMYIFMIMYTYNIYNYYIWFTIGDAKASCVERSSCRCTPAQTKHRILGRIAIHTSCNMNRHELNNRSMGVHSVIMMINV